MKTILISIKTILTIIGVILLLVLDYKLQATTRLHELNYLYSLTSLTAMFLGVSTSLNVNKKPLFNVKKNHFIISIILLLFCLIPVTYWRIHHPYILAPGILKYLSMFASSRNMNLILSFFTGKLLFGSLLEA